MSYFKYKYLKILNMHFIDEKWSKTFSLVPWGGGGGWVPFKQVKLSAIGWENNLNANKKLYYFFISHPIGKLFAK